MATKPFCSVLNEDIIEQILARIPCTNSIVRCTLVCKSWYSLIKSSRFLDNLYLYRPNNTKYLLCTTLSCDGPGLKSIKHSLYFDTEPSDNSVKNGVKLSFPHGEKDIKVHGCCNGVICYTINNVLEENGKIYLWNPTVRKLKVLPRIRDFDYDKGTTDVIGFWFDKTKNDYEVVKITYVSGSVTSSVDLYSLRSDSWKIICDNCPGKPCSSVGTELVYAKGTLHWLAKENPGQSWMIVSLNLNNAEFRETKISCRFEKDILCLIEMDPNSLVILKINGLNPVCDVKVHDRNSLELCYTDSDKSNLSADSFLVGFRNNGEALVHLLSKNKMVSYDFGAKQLTGFDVFFCNHVISACPFVETLVLLNNGEGKDYTNSS